MKLYHTGYDIIEKPIIHFGRSNGDFGHGFYLSDDDNFSHRWAKTKVGQSTYVNSYELDLTDLKIKKFERDTDWFNYIFSNRRGREDAYGEYDIIMGPIANDTIYDVMGVTTSGYLKDTEAIQLLQLGPVYNQIAIKTEKAVQQLTWLAAEELDTEKLQEYRATVEEEKTKFQTMFAEKMESLLG